jgi:3-methylcrotonyl-CoA carboxylase alpha subunit
VEEGAAVTTHYDPMLAKIIVHDTDREAAFARLDEALAATEVLGVRTNLPFLRAVATDPVVRGGQVTTTWLEPAYQSWTSGTPETPPAEVTALAGAAEAARLLDVPPNPDPWAPSAAGPWRLGGPAPLRVVLRPDAGHGAEQVVEVSGTGPFEADGLAVTRAGAHAWTVAGKAAAVAPGADGQWYVLWDGLPYEIAVGPRTRLVDAEGGPAHLGAPMPGTVIAVRVEAGEKVTKGQELVVVEAMKMELAVKANADAIVTAVKCAPGDQVSQNQTLVDLEPTEVDS